MLSVRVNLRKMSAPHPSIGANVTSVYFENERGTNDFSTFENVFVMTSGSKYKNRASILSHRSFNGATTVPGKTSYLIVEYADLDETLTKFSA